MLELTLLGQFTIAEAGQPLTLSSRPAQSLLAYLALQATIMRREKVAGVLWPESDNSNALSNLRHALWRLRKTVGDGYITADKLTLGLNPEAPITIDIHTVLTADDDETAVAAYGGELLPGFYEDWVTIERERLHTHFIERVRRLMKQQLDAEDWSAAIQTAEKWLRFDVAEEAYQALMIAHQALGDRGGIKHSYERCVAALEKELAVEPSAETDRLFGQLMQEPSQSSLLTDTTESACPLYLPCFTTEFIGRQTELAQLKRLIEDPNHSLITLLAPGGMGKTRLAVAAAAAQTNNFADGIYFIPFAPITDLGHLASQIAETLNLDFYLREQAVRWQSDEQYDQLISYLAPKKMLLIFDNVEQLLMPDESKYAGITLTDFVSKLLRQAPQLTVLVTSRERLNLQIETVVPLLGLQLPSQNTNGAPTDYLAQSDAIELFQRSAQHVQPDFAITPDNIQDVIDICQLVGGMPLAVELAAAWQELLPLSVIKEEIASSIDFLETTLRDVPDRHRAVRSVIEGTWQKLNKHEQEAFQKLSIFRGGFRRKAAQVVCDVSLKMLLQLIHKALLTVDETGRYQIHELLRQFGHEKLAESPERHATVHQNHALYYADFLHQQEPALHGPNPWQAMKRIEPELPNARVAWEWAVAHNHYGALEKAMESLCEYHRRRGQLDEGYKLFKPTAEKLGWQGWLPVDQNLTSDRVLQETLQLLDIDDQAAPDTSDRQLMLGKTLARYSRFYCESPDLEQSALQLRQDTLKALRQSGNGRGMAWVVRYLGHVWQRPSQTEQLYRTALTHFERQNDQRGIAETRYRLGVNALERGKFESAVRSLKEGLALCQALGNRVVEASALIRLSEAYWALGQNEAAAHTCEQAIDLTVEINYPALQADGWQILARIACTHGDLDQATTHLEHSQAILEELGLKGLLANAQARLAHVAALGQQTAVARSLAQKSIASCLKRDYVSGSCEAHMALGLITTEPTQALAHLCEAMSIAQTAGMISYHLHTLAYTIPILHTLQANALAQQSLAFIYERESCWHWTKQWLQDQSLLSPPQHQSKLEIEMLTAQIQSLL